MYINVSNTQKIHYDEFVQRAKKMTKAKGIFNSVEENIKDYFKPYQQEDVYLINGNTHANNEGCIFIGLTLYLDLASIQNDLLSGKKENFKRSKRNNLCTKTVLRIVSHFLI